MRTFHDYHLTGYEVRGTIGEIELSLRWPYKTGVQHPPAQVVFRNVQGYFFEHDLGGNILYAIEEVDLEQRVHAEAASFGEQHKWGWPLFWRGTAAQTVELLTQQNAKWFDISSSYGLSGWIVAVEANEKPE